MPYGPNTVPLMTSDNTPSGVASSDSTQTASYLAFDQDDATYWYGGVVNSGWLQYQFAVAVAVAKIRMLGYFQAGYYPKAWTFQGSNDGASWTTLLTETDTSADDNGTYHDYTFANGTPYLYYRIDITEVAANFRAPLIVSLEMMELVYDSTWTGADGDTLVSTAGNWNPAAVPTLTEDVLIAGALPLTFDMYLETKTADVTSYTGTMTALNPHNGHGIAVHQGGINLAAATIVAPYIYVEVWGDSGSPTVDLGSNAVQQIYFDAAGEALSDITVIGEYFWSVGNFDLNGFTIDLTPVATGSSSFIEFDAALTFDAGAKIILRPNAASTGTTVGLIVYNSGAAVLPPLEIHGTGTDYVAPNESQTCQSFLLVSGQWKFNATDLTTVEDMLLTGGSFDGEAGRTITIPGNLSNTGTDLAGGIWNVSGYPQAVGRTIANCDFSGGSELDATEGCTDGGGNANVAFTTFLGNVVPLMFGATSDLGTVSADSYQGVQYPYLAFDRDSATYWYGNVVNSGWLQYQFATAKAINSVSLLGYTAVGYYPKTWTFEGSNDGASWTTLYTAADTSADDDNALHQYLFANTTAYFYYRINITAVSQIIRAPILMALEMTKAVTTTVWDTDAGADDQWDNAANWSNGVPTSVLDAVLLGAGLAQTNATVNAKSINFSAFTGEFDNDTVGNNVEVYGDVILGDGMTFTGYTYFQWNASGSFTRGAAPLPPGSDLELASLTPGVVVTLTEDADIGFAYFPNGGGALDQGTHTLTLVYDNGNGGCSFAGAGSLLWSGAAQLIINILGISGGGLQADAGLTLPPTTVTADVPGLNMQTPPTTHFTSLATDQALLNSTDPLVIDGDLTFANGGGFVDSAQFNATVGGNFLATDAALAKNITNPVYNSAITVAGTAVAHNSVIANLDFSGGTQLNATDGCTDGTLNTNVNFGSASGTPQRMMFMPR